MWKEKECWKMSIFSSVESEEPPADFQLYRALKPLLHLDSIGKKSSQPLPIQGCTHSDRVAAWRLCGTPLRRPVGRTLGWRSGALLLKKMFSFCSIYVHPCFYRSLKLQYPLDVEGVSRDDWVMTELGTGSLRHAVGILTPDNFRTVVDSE